MPWGNWPWAAAGTLFLRLSVRWNAAALPLATLLPVRRSAAVEPVAGSGLRDCTHEGLPPSPAAPGVRATCRAVPALLPQLLTGRSVCHRLLAADPSFAQPFGTVFAALDALQ